MGAMKITRIRQAVAPISGTIANAHVDFSEMTAGIVAVKGDGGFADDTPVRGTAASTCPTRQASASNGGTPPTRR